MTLLEKRGQQTLSATGGGSDWVLPLPRPLVLRRVTDAVLGPCRIVLDMVFPIPTEILKHNWTHAVLRAGGGWGH